MGATYLLEQRENAKGGTYLLSRTQPHKHDCANKNAAPDGLDDPGRFGHTFRINTGGDIDDSQRDRARFDHYFPAITADRATAAPLISAAFAEAEFSWPHARYANQEGAGGMDLRDHLGSITARSLNIAGEHDSLPPERVAEISDGIANASFVVMKNSGHFAPLEEPERFTSEVFAFLGVADAVDQ